MVNSLKSYINYFRKYKMFWISYANINTFHVNIFVRFKNMQKKIVNAFLIENGKMVNSLNSQNNYFGKQKMVLD